MKNNSFIIVFVFTPSAIKNLCPLKKRKKETSNKDRNIEKKSNNKINTQETSQHEDKVP